MTAIKPDMRSAFYRCGSCGASAEVAVERGRVDEPTTCDGCQIRGTMELVHNRSKFIDTQVVTLQEAPLGADRLAVRQAMRGTARGAVAALKGAESCARVTV
jgi:DNA replicative helicase MCM subunit Mcm2 (Cdc46/Mcm family)